VANNRLCLVDDVERRIFCIAKSDGRSWWAPSYGGSLSSDLTDWLGGADDGAQYGCSIRPTELRLVTENEEAFKAVQDYSWSFDRSAPAKGVGSWFRRLLKRR
jgi:hypothetical protein